MSALGELDFATAGRVADPDAAQGEIQRFLTGCGLRYFSFIITQRGDGSAINPSIDLKTSYRDDWTQRYCGRRYDQLDPLLQNARTDTVPIIWGSDRYVRSLGKRQSTFFMEAREFGVQCGVSFPVRSVDGTVGLVTFTAERDDVLSDVLAEQGSRLFVAAHQIMDCFSDIPKFVEAEQTLSPREREALIWVAEGCTSEEIADRMFISVSAVNYHLGNATRKLRARNRHHAALIALKDRLI